LECGIAILISFRAVGDRVRTYGVRTSSIDGQSRTSLAATLR
jgi:hypothetical protein